MNIQAKEVGLHVLGWFLFFSLIIGFISYSPQQGMESGWFTSGFLFFILIYVFIFYVNSYVLVPKFFLTRKYVLYFSILLGLFLIVCFLQPYDHVLSMHRHHHPHFQEGFPFPPPPKPPGFGNDMPPGDGLRPRPKHLDIVSVVLFLTVWSFSTAMQITRQWRDTQRRALQAEADKVNAELSFLKAQINPHFLFNTLNNIYSLAIIKSEQTPNAVMKLSNILRYITDDARQDFVPLQNEVNSVANYIELQKLRLTNKVEIRFAVQGQLEGKHVSPLLFLTFIENAFKYGVSSHEPCVISIEITAEEKSIEFFCQNKILVKEADEERVGVGVNNARKRLDYLYPGKHLLRIQKDNGNFSVHLTLMV